MDRLERRLNEIEQQHQAELKARDEEIARLKSQLGSQPATLPAPSSSPPGPTRDEIDKTKQDILKDIETNHPSPLTIRVPANFNPDLAVIGDFKGSISSNN